jgi:hypothetical protein
VDPAGSVALFADSRIQRAVARTGAPGMTVLAAGGVGELAKRSRNVVSRVAPSIAASNGLLTELPSAGSSDGPCSLPALCD